MNDQQKALIRKSIIANLEFWLSPAGGPEDWMLCKKACHADSDCWDADIDNETMSRMMKVVDDCHRLIAERVPEVNQ